MRKAALSLVMSLALIQLSNSALAEIPWQTNLRTAHSSAEENSKLLLLHFYTDNCTWCEKLEKGSFAAPQVIEAIGQSFVPVKVNAEANPRLAEMFKVTKFPTDVVVTTGGKTLVHQVSPQRPNEYVEMLAGTLEGPAAGETPAASVAASTAQAPAYAQTPASESGVVATPASAKKDGGMSVPAQSITTPADDTNASLAGFRNQNASPSLNNSPVDEESPELAMEGFCAVTVISEDKWVEGKSEHGVIHLGKLYLFDTEEKMKQFLADPVPFTPVLNEIDVVRFFEERKIVPGKREWGLKDPVYQRMFFFADEAAMNHFYNEYERYTDAAVDVMDKAIADSNPGT